MYFGDRVAVLNDFIYQTGGSSVLKLTHDGRGAPWSLCSMVGRLIKETGGSI
jgi:hypothetical protein